MKLKRRKVFDSGYLQRFGVTSATRTCSTAATKPTSMFTRIPKRFPISSASGTDVGANLRENRTWPCTLKRSISAGNLHPWPNLNSICSVLVRIQKFLQFIKIIIILNHQLIWINQSLVLNYALGRTN